MYFDQEGTAALKTTELISGAPFIEGLEIREAKVKMNQKLPVTEKKIFERIVEVTRLLKKYELDSDRLILPGWWDQFDLWSGHGVAGKRKL